MYSVHSLYIYIHLYTTDLIEGSFYIFLIIHGNLIHTFDINQFDNGHTHNYYIYNLYIAL